MSDDDSPEDRPYAVTARLTYTEETDLEAESAAQAEERMAFFVQDDIDQGLIRSDAFDLDVTAVPIDNVTANGDPDHTVNYLALFGTPVVIGMDAAPGTERPEAVDAAIEAYLDSLSEQELRALYREGTITTEDPVYDEWDDEDCDVFLGVEPDDE